MHIMITLSPTYVFFGQKAYIQPYHDCGWYPLPTTPMPHRRPLRTSPTASKFWTAWLTSIRFSCVFLSMLLQGAGTSAQAQPVRAVHHHTCPSIQVQRRLASTPSSSSHANLPVDGSCRSHDSHTLIYHILVDSKCFTFFIELRHLIHVQGVLSPHAATGVRAKF